MSPSRAENALQKKNVRLKGFFGDEITLLAARLSAPDTAQTLPSPFLLLLKELQ